MASRRISLKDFPKVLRQRLEDDVELMRLVMRETALRGVTEAVALTNERGSVDLGFFKNAWNDGFKATESGAELRNNAPYAAVIEHGRRPKAPGPPLEPILEWVESKLVRNGEVEPGDAEWVAEAIRWSIHVKGTPPKGILYDVSQLMKKWAREDAVRRLRAKSARAKRGST